MQQLENQELKYYCNVCHLAWRHDSEQQNDGRYFRSICPSCGNEAHQKDAQKEAYKEAHAAIDQLILDSYARYRDASPNDAGMLTLAKVIAWNILENKDKI